MNSYGKQSTDLRDALVVGWQVWKKSLTQGPKIQEFESAVEVKEAPAAAEPVKRASKKEEAPAPKKDVSAILDEWDNE